MADPDDRTPASTSTAMANVLKMGSRGSALKRDLDTTYQLRKELEEKGLKGFKKGGKVKKTGPAKLHKGEFVVKAPAAKKAGPQKLKALNQSQRDIAMLKRKKA